RTWSSCPLRWDPARRPLRLAQRTPRRRQPLSVRDMPWRAPASLVSSLFVSSKAACGGTLRSAIHQQPIIAREIGQFVAARIPFQAVDEQGAAAAKDDFFIAHEVLGVLAGPCARAAGSGLLQFHFSIGVRLLQTVLRP